MTIEELPSGSYRIRMMEKGKRYSLVIDHKPTDSEAVRLIAAVIASTPSDAPSGTFKAASVAYNASKSNVLSASTIREYERYARLLPDSFTRLHLMRITARDVQKVINDLTPDRNPKTVANYAHYISAVLAANGIRLPAPKLPQRIRSVQYIPTADDIKATLDALKGTEHELAIRLCCFGLRRSEVCALTPEDLDNNTLHISKAVVKDKNRQYVVKTTKTTASDRYVVIPADLADQIRQQGYIYKYNPDNLYKALQRAQDRAGVPHFRLHALRHFFASYLHDLGYSDKQVQALGGWSTDNIMKTIYQHAMDMDAAKQRASDDISKIIG